MGNLEHWFPKVGLTNAVSTTNHLDMVYKHGHCSEVADNSYIYSMRSGQHRDTCAQYLLSVFGGI